MNEKQVKDAARLKHGDEHTMPLKSTPGPWKVDRIRGRIADDEDYPSVVGFRVSASEFHYARETVEANARLIAAAPELLDALKRFVNREDYSLNERQDNWLSARALITRIEGKDV